MVPFCKDSFCIAHWRYWIFLEKALQYFMKACVNISLSIALVVKRVSFSSVHGTPNEWSRSRLSIVRIIFSFTYSRTVMHKMGSCGTKVDTRPRMSENNANYYGVKMHHSEHRSFIQETSEKGKNQIQDHLVNRLQREFNYLQPSDMKKVNV